MSLYQKYKQNSLSKRLLESADQDLGLIKSLLQKGADIHAVNATGKTLLDLANFEKNITFFLAYGIAFSNADKLNQALFNCVNTPDSLSKLIAMGGDVNFAHGHSFPLRESLLHKNEKSLTLLLEANADVNQRDPYGNTVLHYAINKENIGAVRLLLKHNARTNIADNQGEAAIDLALHLDEITNKSCYLEMLSAFILHEEFVLPAKGTTYKLPVYTVKRLGIQNRCPSSSALAPMSIIGIQKTAHYSTMRPITDLNPA